MPGIRGYLIGQTVLVMGFDGNLTIYQHGLAYLQIFVKWSICNLLMLIMVLHTLLIHLTVHSEGSTQRGQVFVLMFYFVKYAYHFRHIVEMFWAPMHGAQVPKV